MRAQAEFESAGLPGEILRERRSAACLSAFASLEGSKCTICDTWGYAFQVIYIYARMVAFLFFRVLSGLLKAGLTRSMGPGI